MPLSSDASPNKLANVKIYLTPIQIMHGRKVYEVLSLIGDLGGVMGVLTLVLGFFIFPLSEALYIMKSTKRMFLVKTNEKDLFAH